MEVSIPPYFHTNSGVLQMELMFIFIPICPSEFQRRVLYLLADIREKLSQVGQNCEPPDSQFHLVKMNSRRELKNLEGQLADKGKKNQFNYARPILILFLSYSMFSVFLIGIFYYQMSQSVKIGGADLEDCVKNMMKR